MALAVNLADVGSLIGSPGAYRVSAGSASDGPGLEPVAEAEEVRPGVDGASSTAALLPLTCGGSDTASEEARLDASGGRFLVKSGSDKQLRFAGCQRPELSIKRNTLSSDPRSSSGRAAKCVRFSGHDSSEDGASNDDEEAPVDVTAAAAPVRRHRRRVASMELPRKPPLESLLPTVLDSGATWQRLSQFRNLKVPPPRPPPGARL